MEEYLYSHSEFMWMILGIGMITLEMLLTFGIGFLFVGLGSLTIFALLKFNLVEYNFLNNVAVFLIATAAWWGALWYPMKCMKRTKNSYQDLVGSVITLSTDIPNGHVGSVIWSGVTMRAALDKDENASTLKKGTKARVESIKGNVLYLMRTK